MFKEELLNEPVFDAIHYRNIDVETRLGLKIKSVAQPGSYEQRNEWNNTLSVSVLTNTGDFDGACFYLSYGVALAKEGIYYNLLSVTKDDGGYLDFEKPWWNQTLVDELSTYGSLFFAGGSLTLTEVSVPTVDIGLPQLAMHSAYEMIARVDVDSMVNALCAFFGTDVVLTERGCAF